MNATTTKRTYIHLNRAWYANAAKSNEDYVDEVMMEIGDEAGTVSAEFAMRWYAIQYEYIPRLEVFEDGWAALASQPELIATLGAMNSTGMTPEQFCNVLNGLGFIDETPTEYTGRGIRP